MRSYDLYLSLVSRVDKSWKELALVLNWNLPAKAIQTVHFPVQTKFLKVAMTRKVRVEDAYWLIPDIVVLGTIKLP